MDRFEISMLRSYYGALLTDKQNDMLAMHYDEDLSYGEIADICGVSRQAVLDGINKGEKHLVEFESKLHLVDKDARICKILDEMSSLDSSSINIKAYADRIKSIVEE